MFCSDGLVYLFDKFVMLCVYSICETCRNNVNNNKIHRFYHMPGVNR